MEADNMNKVNVTLNLPTEVAQWVKYLDSEGIERVLNYLLKMEQEGRIVILKNGGIMEIL